MFLYEQGYEIDGSDSSYNLVDCEIQKILEVVKYILNLKIVNRKNPIKIKYSESLSYNRSKWKEKTIKWENLEKLDALFQNPKLSICEIYYPLMKVNRLYPNVKREIIDILLEREQKHSKCPQSYQKPHMENPVFISRYEERNSDVLTIYINEEMAKSVYECIELDLQKEKIVQKIIQNSCALLEINSIVGANRGYHLYMIKKIAERFPEYEIDVEDIMQYYETYFYSGYGELAERVYIDGRNVEELLHYLWKEKGVSFLFQQDTKKRKYTNWREDLITDEDVVTLVHIPTELEKYLESCKMLNKREPLYELLFAASKGKINLSFGEYAAYVDKLKNASLLSDYEFEQHTEIYFYYEKKEKKSVHTYLCRMGYERKDGNIQLYADIPYKLFDSAKNK